VFAIGSADDAAYRNALANYGDIDHNSKVMLLTSIQRHRPGGFTVVEVMVALAIVAILVGVAAPSFRTALMNMRMSAAANDLIADLSFARSEASKLNVTVFICASTNNVQCNTIQWNRGWIIFPDLDGDRRRDANEDLLKARTLFDTDIAAANRITVQTCGDAPLASGGRSVGYSPVGTTGVTGAAFALCDGRTTPDAGRLVRIIPSGRPAVSKITCGVGGFAPAC